MGTMEEPGEGARMLEALWGAAKFGLAVGVVSFAFQILWRIIVGA